jgi:hypothetical protein
MSGLASMSSPPAKATLVRRQAACLAGLLGCALGGREGGREHREEEAWSRGRRRGVEERMRWAQVHDHVCGLGEQAVSPRIWEERELSKIFGVVYGTLLRMVLDAISSY